MKKSGLIAGLITGIFGISLVSAAWTFTGMLNEWAAMGVFKYVLPF